MNPKNLGKLLEDVAKYGPIIVAGAEGIYRGIKEWYDKKKQPDSVSKGISLADLGERVEQLEKNELEQSKLFSDLAKQNEKLSILANAFATRFWIAIAVASLSIIFSILLLIIK